MISMAGKKREGVAYEEERDGYYFCAGWTSRDDSIPFGVFHVDAERGCQLRHISDSQCQKPTLARSM
jgi:hypothetical protein